MHRCRHVVLALDEDYRLVGMAPLPRNHEPLETAHIVEIVRELGAAGAVAATLRPGGDQPTPGETDVTQFRRLVDASAAERVTLFDWVIFAGYGWWSMRERSGSGAAFPRRRDVEPRHP
ncbi:MAG: JAB domain-containing protein [Acidimicrobiia bacterium]